MLKLNILIIEDDEDEQYFITRGFTGSGLFNIVAILHNAENIVTYLNTLQPLPDIILSDLKIPGKDGYEILKELKADIRFADIPFIITSNTVTPDVINKGKSLGAYNVLAKPINLTLYDALAKSLYDDFKKQ